MIPRNLVLARTLAALAILTTPTFVWFGWWTLAISIGIGVFAVLAEPRPEGIPAEGLLARVAAGVNRRLHPHAWRPRWR
jgi:hypothetical protein